jgi:hypothetical protein
MMDYKAMISRYEDKPIKSAYQVCREMTNGYTENTSIKKIDFSIVLVSLTV